MMKVCIGNNSCHLVLKYIILIALKSQASHVPVRFLTELLWNHHTVILTGKYNYTCLKFMSKKDFHL